MMSRVLWVGVGLACLGLAAALVRDALREPSLDAAPALTLVSSTDASARSTGSVSPDVVLGHPTGRENAAAYYLAAVNSYAARRPAPARFAHLPGFVKDPSISPAEVHALLMAARQRRCSFYEELGGQPRFQFRGRVDTPAWPFTFATDPYEARPYTALFRLVARAAQDEAARLEAHKQLPRAEVVLRAVARLGVHLRQDPGCLMDSQLGWEIERGALDRLARFYRSTQDSKGMARLRRYEPSFAAGERAFRGKFASLDDVATALRTAREDRSPLWRIEALAAVRTALHTQPLRKSDRGVLSAALRDACRDTDPRVSAAAVHIVSLPASAFQENLADAPFVPAALRKTGEY